VGKRTFQGVMFVLALIPVGTGLIGMLGLRDPLYVRFGVVPNVVLDSNMRFFSGVWLGLGVALFAILKRIERHGTLFRALWLMIFLGGLGRVVSWVDAGTPPAPFIAFIALELVGAPVFVLWHRRLEGAADRIA
jgi:hypothetical protein